MDFSDCTDFLVSLDFRGRTIEAKKKSKINENNPSDKLVNID